MCCTVTNHHSTASSSLCATSESGKCPSGIWFRSSEAELGVPLARSVAEVDAFLQRHLGGRLLDQSL